MRQSIRRFCLDHLGIPHSSNIDSLVLALEIAAQDEKCYLGFSLNNKPVALSFLKAWAYNNGYSPKK